MVSPTAPETAASNDLPAVLTNAQRVADALRARFQKCRYSAIRRVDCDVREGVAILRGFVPTYHMRQIAIELARSVEGVRAIDDGIHVGSQQKTP